MTGGEHLAKELLTGAPSGVLESINDVWAMILGDRLSYHRRVNAMKLSKKLHEEAERMGAKINPDRVPDQFAYEWVEAATRKSDDSIQQMFARLLAKAATSGGSTDERLIYALREMSGEDAVLFQGLYGQIAFRALIGDRGYESSALHIFTRDLAINVELASDNLRRLNLVREITQLLAAPSLKICIVTKPSALGLLLFDQIRDDDDDPIRKLTKGLQGG